MTTTDLVRYLASEIAADGPEGSSVDRVNGFIDSYAHQQASSSTSEQNTIDDDLRNYLIQILGRLPNISPGCFIKVKSTTDKSGKGKGSNKGKGKRDASSDDGKDDHTETPLRKINSASIDFSGDHVQVQESDKGKTLKDLLDEYGDRFRLVADRNSIDTICSGMIQGMSAAVYHLFLFVMRARGKGVAFPEIGKKFHYTTSTIFFLVKQLCDFGMGIKFKAKYGNNQVAWIVAKQYAHLCSKLSHENLQDGQDETSAESGIFQIVNECDGKDTQMAEASLQEMSSEAVQDLIRRREKSQSRREAAEGSEGEGDEEEVDGGADDEDAEINNATTNDQDTSEMVTLHGLLAYPAVDIDRQDILLQDRSLIRMRILKLLFASKNNATIRTDLIVRIGIKEPSPGMRKIFNAILRQMEAENLVTRCMLRRPLHHDKEHKEFCWMATEEGREHLDQVLTSTQQREINRLSVEFNREMESSKSRLLLEISVNRQILDKIDQSEEEGITIERLNMLFGGNNDRRRDLDHMLTALKKPSNAYYDDFAVFSGLEQDGRTRSQRFYTRKWRPGNLAPNEARGIDQRNQNAWVKLPFEIDTSNASQERGKGKEKSSQRITDEEDENEASESDGSITHVTRRPRKKAKARARVSESEEVKIKGRPRKDHSEKALEKAKKYLEKKEARMKEEEEKRGVESLLGESSAVISKTKKARGSPSKTSSEVINREASTQTPSRSIGEAATQTDFDESIISNRKHHRDSSRTITSSPVAPATKRAPSQSTLGDAQRPQKRIRDVKKRPSTNLTLQLKYDALREFFLQTQIFESTAFESLYSTFLISKFGSEINLQPYEMDRKLRLKMLNEFERSGFINFKKVPAPIVSKEKLRTVWHIKDIDEEDLIHYCREVTSGDIRRDGSRRKDGRWVKPMIKPQILLEAHEVDRVDSFLMRLGSDSALDVANLEEIVSNQSIREIFMDYENVRAQYTGRLYGQGAQSRYLHTTVMQLFKRRGAKEYLKGDWIIDLSWWTSEASLEQLLKLVTPSSKDEMVVEASQNLAFLGTPVKNIAKEIQIALNVSVGMKGIIDLLRPLMNIICSFDLAQPVQESSDGQIVETTTDEETLTFRFRTKGVIEKSQLQSDAIDTFDLNDPIDIERYWQIQQEIFTSSEFEVVRREMTPEQIEMYTNLFTKTSWSLHYFMLKPQKKYLQKTMSLGIGAKVVNDEEVLEKISKTCLTPKSIVRRWYERRFKVRSDVNTKRVRLESEKKGRIVTKEKSTSTRQLNAIKKKEVKERRNRLSEFNNTVNACLMDLKIGESDRATMMSKLVHVKRQYGRGKMLLSMKRIRNLFREVMRGHEAGDTTWKDILNRRRRPMKPGISLEDKQDQNKNVDKEGPRSRKSTIAWTRDRDELLRDAVVILRCRDRYRAKNPNIIRKNWAALDQIFPDVGAPSRTSRFELLEKAVGEEQYLQQLEIEWDKVWAEHRGGELEDDYPADPTNFNLSQHIDFLRLHIDKVQVARDVDNATSDPLPLDHRLMQYYFDYDRPLPSHENGANILAHFALAEFSGEAKSKAIRSNAFTLGGDQGDGIIPLTTIQERKIGDANREKGLMMGAVKMILCTEELKYSEPIATNLCTSNASGEIIDEAISEMIDLHIIKRKSKEDREIPDRNMIFTEEYDKFYQDSLETVPIWNLIEDLDVIMKSGGKKLYQTMQDEETAASLMLLGMDKVDASIDFTPIEKFKDDVFFNAKKLNDSKLEVPVELKLRGKRLGIKKKWTELADEVKVPHKDDVLKWFDIAEEAIESRVDSAWERLIGQLEEEEEVEDARRLQGILSEAGPVGLSKSELWNRIHSNRLPLLLKVTMRDANLPLIFVAGYTEARLVSSQYIQQWTIKLVSGHRLFPHKWNDIYGNHLGEIWSSSFKLIIHAIVTRPGITLAQVLNQFKLVMDRSEVCRIIDHACHLQVIHKCLSSDDSIKGDQAEWQAREDDDLTLIADFVIG